MFRKESARFWDTSLWWVNTLIWLLILNGFLGIMLFATSRQVDGSTSVNSALGTVPIFFSLISIFVPIGTILLCHDTVYGEVNSGTAEWILSKPIARESFILSKIASNALGIAITMFLPQGAISYLQLSLIAHRPLEQLPYIAAYAMLYLAALFYLVLTISLSSISKSRPLILAIPIAIVFTGQLGDVMPWLANILPWGLLEPAIGLVTDGRATPVTPLYTIPAISAAIAFLTAWHYRQAEF